MRLPHFLRKFAMTKRGRKSKKVIRKIDSRFRGNDIERAGMTKVEGYNIKKEESIN